MPNSHPHISPLARIAKDPYEISSLKMTFMCRYNLRWILKRIGSLSEAKLFLLKILQNHIKIYKN